LSAGARFISCKCMCPKYSTSSWKWGCSPGPTVTVYWSCPLPSNHNEVRNKWSCVSCAPYTFMYFKHVNSTFITIYSHYITYVCLHGYVFVFTSDVYINFSFMHTPTHIQHSVICKTFTFGITTGWCFYFKLAIPMCYFKINLS